MLLKKANPSVEMQEQINLLEKEVTLWTYYKQFKKASAPWATAGEDHDMSKRLRSAEIFFYRNLEKPEMWSLLMMSLQYVTDICYKEWHVAPAPTILIQSMPSGFRGWEIGEQSSTREEIAKNKT
jgi:hypothetical protein